MATEVKFEEIKCIDPNIKHTVSGYIRECQSLFPYMHNPYYIIPQLIEFTVLLFYNEPEAFDINGETTFDYIRKVHGNYFRVFGTKTIHKQYIKRYKWTIETSDNFNGRFGIINDIPAAYKRIQNGKCYWRNPEVTNIGSAACGHDGTLWGSGGYNSSVPGSRDLNSFISRDADIIDMIIDYAQNTISFESQLTKKKQVKPLKSGLEKVKFVIECTNEDSTIKMTHSGISHT